ncbi:MAG: AMP-binding protein [Betaproteobacteria bacterium]|jgi:phenylacetate-CoA ligase|nr:AMP-binding protein [Betaproteobacteria bacterium]
MGLYTSLISSALFPLHERFKKHDSVKVRKEMESSQWWDERQLKELQFSKLCQLLKHTQTHVPYYRKLFEEIGFKVENMRSITDLRRIPFLDKSKIRANTEALKSEIAQDLASFNTSGSSGEPLIFYIGKKRVSHDVAAKWRATRWWGVDIGDPEIVVWGSPIELDVQDNIRILRDRLFRTKLLPAFEMSEQKLDGFLEEIRTMRPKMLFGYPSALSHIARYADTRKQDMSNLDIRVAFVTSERLYDEQRLQINRTFNCPVANGYGGRDSGFIAHECPEGGMHLTAEDIIVEIVNPNGISLPPGESGEIVVTHLATEDFPFIRYRTGDIGVLDTNICNCGRGLPLLQEIQGRSTDFLVAQDGTIMHGLALIYILRDLPQVSAFKIIQESLSLTHVYVVSENGLSPKIVKDIELGFKDRLGHEVKITIHEVAEIPAEKSGKFRYVVSMIASSMIAPN